METKVVFKATKKEILDLLKLLARISDCYSHVDKEQKILVLSTALSAEERDLDAVTEYNKQLAKLDGDGFDYIVEAEEIILLDK